ncbi:Protein AUXIN SIGNALING F-BOX 3 [Datura stramonium]|uniref:Protein AUXIN SIGNALING F-BOX 3 n=1 Tax=Datura stramonium TaxID=4076 RepID=A0ABS8SB67_DATST|nr:Protein AUXIN SIGNALING F-BOX 3 [Datura stramonium]
MVYGGKVVQLLAGGSGGGGVGPYLTSNKDRNAVSLVQLLVPPCIHYRYKALRFGILFVYFETHHLRITEEGIVAASVGCPKLKKLKDVCTELSNEARALIIVAENCPNLVSFILHTTEEDRAQDVMAMQPLDEGFGATVQLCKGLKRLRLCERLTAELFFYIGMYAEQL